MEFKPIESINTINELKDYRAKINESLNEREKYINKCITAHKLGHDSFYSIKENFESLSPKLFKSENGKKIISKYQKTVSESKNLTSLYSLYENIRKANKSVDVDTFINSLCGNNWIKNEETINEDIERLGSVLSEAYIEVGDITDIKNCDAKVDNAVNYIVENRKSKNNIAEYSAAMKIIKEHILSKDGECEVVNENSNFDSYVNRLVSDFNEKYSENNLSPEELAIMKEFCETNDHEKIFEHHKEVCKKKLSEAKNEFAGNGDNESAMKIATILEQVDSKQYNSSSVFNDVISMVGLSNVFENEK
jgi:hypothetical protein